jgi:hypothetical protein
LAGDLSHRAKIYQSASLLPGSEQIRHVPLFELLLVVCRAHASDLYGFDRITMAKPSASSTYGHNIMRTGHPVRTIHRSSLGHFTGHFLGMVGHAGAGNRVICQVVSAAQVQQPLQFDGYNIPDGWSQ